MFDVDLSFIDEMIEQCEKFKSAIEKVTKQKPKWTFTEDEKVILRNLPKEYNWIGRSKSGNLYLFLRKPSMPVLGEDIGLDVYSGSLLFMYYSHLFQTIQWEDDEPCEFRKYLDE